MVPYIEQPLLRLGPVTIAAFGVIVASSVLLGLWIGGRRFRALGLDPALGEGLAWWVVAGGLVGAHLFSVLLYFPHRVAENPLILLKLWEDISSFGGIVGGAIAIWLFLHRRGAHLDVATRWAFVDVAAFVFPISLMVGRIACTIAHDHPGTLTTTPLAVSLARPEARAYITHVYDQAGRTTELARAGDLAALGFHDLGWYEFLYLALVVVPVTLGLAHRERRRGSYGVHRPGTYLVAFIALYMPVRFALDFLRVTDVRYGGLTPAQWGALAALAALPLIIRRVRSLPSRTYAPDGVRDDGVAHRVSAMPDAVDPAATPPPSGTTRNVAPGRGVGGARATFWIPTLLVPGLDAVTKYLAHTRIPEHALYPIAGDWVRLTLLYNPGAAFGLSLGAYSRWIFTALTLGALVVLGSLYRATRPADRLRALALGLVMGGALGNLVNRFWSARGVVDWIDVGFHDHRWPAFNVADIGVSVGALLLAAVFWREDRASPVRDNRQEER